MHHVREMIYKTTKNILESALAVCLLILGVSMVMLALPFLISYYMNLPPSLFFVIFGLLLIIIAVVSLDHINKRRND